MIEDRVELVETDDTYLELWERLSVPERGSWLAEHGFRLTASKERVTVSQGSVSASVGRFPKNTLGRIYRTSTTPAPRAGRDRTLEKATPKRAPWLASSYPLVAATSSAPCRAL